MSVGKMSVGQMYFVEMSVGQMSVGQFLTAKCLLVKYRLSCYVYSQKYCWPVSESNVFRENGSRRKSTAPSRSKLRSLKASINSVFVCSFFKMVKGIGGLLLLLTLTVTSLGGKVKRDEAIEFQLCPGNIFIYKSYFINLNTGVKTSNQVYSLTINFHLTGAQCYKTFYIRNLQIFWKSYHDCLCQAFGA